MKCFENSARTENRKLKKKEKCMEKNLILNLGNENHSLNICNSQYRYIDSSNKKTMSVRFANKKKQNT